MIWRLLNRRSSTYYLKLITDFVPRPITNDTEFIATQNRINSILDKPNLTQDDRDYLKVLGMLIYDYEDKYEKVSPLTIGELIQALLEESGLENKDLIGIFDSESIVLDILQEKRSLTHNEKEKLAILFKTPLDFFENK
jgi:HTH-type transcriptional regulator/antitoxin HigA